MISTNEKYHITEVICKNSKVTQKVLREYLKRYSLLPYVCENCKCDGHWQNGLISLELDHKDGDNTNNYSCPTDISCHNSFDFVYTSIDSSKERRFMCQEKVQRNILDFLFRVT